MTSTEKMYGCGFLAIILKSALNLIDEYITLSARHHHQVLVLREGVGIGNGRIFRVALYYGPSTQTKRLGYVRVRGVNHFSYRPSNRGNS